MEAFETFMKGLLFVIGFGAILFLTYVTTRYVAGRSNKAMKGKHINVIETVSLGMDKRIHLVKAGGQYVLIATTSKSVEFLSAVSIPEEDDGEVEAAGIPNLQNVFDFKSLFEKYVNSYKTNKTAKAGKSAGAAQEIEDAAAGGAGKEGFRSNLDRLRSITQGIKVDTKHSGDDITNEK